jgi:Putative Actinobacterial Holin-X, holin superfamily III
MTIVESDELRHRSTVQLFRDLTQQATTLAHQEIELVRLEFGENVERAKAEMAEKGKTAGMAVAALIAAGVAALLALGALTATLILVLDDAMPTWTAALVVTAMWGVVAIPLALFGRRKIGEIGPPVPERTIEEVKEDVTWLKNQMS